MASLTLVFILVVCLAHVLHRRIDSEATTAAAVPAQETCTVSTVTEGEPAVMTFKLRSGIDTTSKKFFAHLRRNDRKLTDIVTCDGLKIACDVKDGHPMFQVDDNNIKENLLTVRISKMSRELEDTYVLQVYFDGTTEPPNSCTLNITNTQTTPMAGDEDGSNDWIAAPIVCLLLIFGILLLFYRKTILACWQNCRKRRASKPDKTTRNEDRNTHVHEADNADGAGVSMLGNDTPTSRSNAEENLDNSYEGKRTTRNEDRNPHVHEADNADGAEGDSMLGAHTNAHTQSPRPNAEENLKNSHEGTRTTRNEDRNPHVNEADNADGAEGDSMLGVHTNAHTQSPRPNAEENLKNAHEGKRWFVGTLGDQDVDKLFEFEKNGPGSFVITQKEMDQYSFTLFVCCKEGKLRRFQISQTEDAFTVEVSSKTFKTLCDLVAHFRDRRIGNSGIKLAKPYQEEPNEAWYFGRLTREEAGKLFSSENDGTGSFAVYESITEPEKYALSVKFDGKPCWFTIALHVDGFKINAGDGTYFKTLPDLVEHYKENELTYNPRLNGTLGEPCEKLLTDKQKEILSTNGPGSYFIKPCIGSSQQVLAVHTNDKVKPFTIIRTAQGYRLADVAVHFGDMASLMNHYKRNAITVHGTEYGRLVTDCTQDIVNM